MESLKHHFLSDSYQLIASFTTIFLSLVLLALFGHRLSIWRNKFKNLSDSGTFFSYFPSDFNKSSVERILSEVGHYCPPWWYSPNLGTIVAFGKDFECQYDEEIVEAADGCRFIVCWYPRRPYLNADLDNNPLETELDCEGKRKQVVLYVPGLGLHADSKVSKNYALSMAKKNYVVGIVGVRGEKLSLTCHRRNHGAILRPWHPALIDDLLATIFRLHRLLPGESNSDILDVFLTGYSAGGNIVQKTVQAIRERSLQGHQNACDNDQKLIRGAFCLCVNFDYCTALYRLEQTWLGKMYSFFICSVSTDILRKHQGELVDQLAIANNLSEDKEKLIMDIFPQDTSNLLSLLMHIVDWKTYFPSHSFLSVEPQEFEQHKISGLLSNFDFHAWRMRGFSSVEDQFRAFSMFDVRHIAVPTLMLQPQDDPLHLGNALQNIDLNVLRQNENIILMAPKSGNHFGFYEGSLWEAIMSSNCECYSYPGRVSESFFKSVMELYHQKQEKRKRPIVDHHNFSEQVDSLRQLRSLQRREIHQHDLLLQKSVIHSMKRQQTENSMNDKTIL